MMFDSSLPVREILATLLVGFILIQWYRIRQQRKLYPPGPVSLPVLGNLHQIVKAGGTMEFYRKYQEIHGNVYTVTFAGDYRVVISGYENMQFLLVKHGGATSKRNVENMPDSLLDTFNERPGLVFSPDWRELRHQSSKYLRDEGMGKTVLEPLILDEVENFCDWFIVPSLGQAVEIYDPMTLVTSNIIYKMLLGKRFEYDDPVLHENKDIVKKTMASCGLASITKNIPFVNWMPGDPFQQQKCKGYMLKIFGYFDAIVRDRRLQIKDGTSPDLLVDHLLMACKESDDAVKYDKNLSSTLEQLYGAGTETTATILNWAFLYLSVYPEIQTKIQEEVDSVSANGGTISYGQKAELPYTEAVLLETLRHSNMVVVLLPHELEMPLEVEGKVIPGNTELIFNMQSVFQDATIFEKPREFNPDRFLTGDVKLKRACANLTFGLGKRSCLGESLAKMEVLLVLTALVQKYTWTYEGVTLPSLKGNCRFNNKPQPYRLIFERR